MKHALTACMILALLATGCRSPNTPMDAANQQPKEANDIKGMHAGETVQVQPAPVKLFFLAITACGMRDVLRSPGPYTIFVPTDGAFAAMPRPELESLMEPQNKDKLQEFIACHIFTGAYPSSDLATMKELQTRDGRRLAIAKDDRGMRIGNAHVIESDIVCSNGIIHIVDTVLTP